MIVIDTIPIHPKYPRLYSLMLLLLLGFSDKGSAQSFDWQPKPVTETILDSTSGSPIEDVNIEYRCLEETDNHEMVGYYFLTDSLGKSTKEVWVRREITGITATSAQNNNGIGIRGDGMISVQLGGIIRDISIYDLTGRMVGKVVTKAPEGQVLIRSGIASLPTGMYLAVARGMDGREVSTRFVQTVNSNMNWQTSPGYYPLRGTAGWQAGDRKSMAVDEITTRFLRTITYDNVSRIDTVILTYDEGKDTTLVTKLNIPPREYGREVVIHFIASIPGKHIPDGVPVYLDDLSATTAGDSTMFTYKTTNEQEEKELRVQGAEGYEDLQARITIDEENERATQTIEAKEFYAPINAHVKDDDQGDAAGASMELDGKQAFADEQGKAAFRIKLETDQYNHFTPYNKTLKVSRGNSEHDFDTKEQDVKMDTTNQSIDQVVQFINEFYLHSNNSTPGMSVKIWQAGQATSQTTSDAKGNYQTLTTKSTQLTLTPDSVTYDKEGMIPQTTTPTLHDGGDQADIILEPEPTINTYHEKVVFANQTADEYDDGLVFIIKTLKDGAEHTTNVQAAQHVQDLEITGAYEPTDSIEAYYTSTSANAAGKEANILTITRSYEQPTASNGSRNTKLKTTIEDLFNQEPDTTWILSMSTDLYNDVAFKTHVAGAKEWVHSENGKRTMNINGITRSVDISEGTYADDLTTDEIQAIRDRAALFNQDFWNRATGLKILQVKYHETPTYPVEAGNVNYFFDRTEPQPGNNHLLKETTRGYTWDYGGGHVLRGTMEYLYQFTEEDLQATVWIFDDAGGVNGVYAHDSNDKPYLLREDDLIVPYTYVGGKGPRNE